MQSTNNHDDEYLARAIQLAKIHSASGDNGPFGAVIVKDHQIIAEGWNQVVETQDPTAHAEVVAIRNACEHLKTHTLQGCVLYSSCEPCPMCLSASIWARLDKVVFAEDRFGAADAGFDDELIYAAFNPSHQQKSGSQIIVCEHRPQQDATEVFDIWKNNPKRKAY